MTDLQMHHTQLVNVRQQSRLTHHRGDVVGVNVLNLAQLFAVQSGVEVNVVPMADGDDPAITG